jgi:hypothetical protein
MPQARGEEGEKSDRISRESEQDRSPFLDVREHQTLGNVPVEHFQRKKLLHQKNLMSGFAFFIAFYFLRYLCLLQNRSFTFFSIAYHTIITKNRIIIITNTGTPRETRKLPWKKQFYQQRLLQEKENAQSPAETPYRRKDEKS